MMHHERVPDPADCLPGEAVITLYFDDQKPLQGPAALLDWRLDGQLTRLLLDGEATGRAGEHVMLQGNGKLQADWALFVGGGKWHGLSSETHASLVRHMFAPGGDRCIRQKAQIRTSCLGLRGVRREFRPRQMQVDLLISKPDRVPRRSVGDRKFKMRAPKRFVEGDSPGNIANRQHKMVERLDLHGGA